MPTSYRKPVRHSSSSLRSSILFQTRVALLKSLRCLLLLAGDSSTSRVDVEDRNFRVCGTDPRVGGSNDGNKNNVGNSSKTSNNCEEEDTLYRNQAQDFGRSSAICRSSPTHIKIQGTWGIMIRPSTQQAVDRIVGTAVILGISIAFVRWLSDPPRKSGDDDAPENFIENAEKELRLKEDHQDSFQKHDEESGEGDAYFKFTKNNIFQNSDAKKTEEEEEKTPNNEDDCELVQHLGSCHCGSVNFVLSGPQRLQAVDSPGKIRYPHVPTLAGRFQILRGEHDLRFYYIEKSDAQSGSSARDHAPSGAHAFCGNCGVHILRAPDRSSDALEVNANCLEDGDTQQKMKLVFRKSPLTGKGLSTSTRRGKQSPTQYSSSSSISSLVGVDNIDEKDSQMISNVSSPNQHSHSFIKTVSENEPLLEGSGSYSSDYTRNFWDILDGLHQIQRKESVCSALTQPESTTIMSSTNTIESDSILDAPPLAQSVAESDDFSMGSSSVTAASVILAPPAETSITGSIGKKSKLPPLSPTVPSDRSIKTLPPRWDDNRSDTMTQQPHGEYRRYASSGNADAGGSGDWSVTSLESNDMKAKKHDVGKTTVTPKMRDQMKYYMSRHMTT